MTSATRRHLHQTHVNPIVMKLSLSLLLAMLMPLLLPAQAAIPSEEDLWETHYAAVDYNDRIDLLAKYLSTYPRGKYRIRAIDEINDLKVKTDEHLWEIAGVKNTCAAYKKYLIKFPRGKYLAQAKRKINELCNDLAEPSEEGNPCVLWQRVKDQGLDRISDFYRRYKGSGGSCMEEINTVVRSLEDNIFRQAGTNCEAIPVYLKYFPDGRYAVQARQLLLNCEKRNAPEESAWASMNKNSPASLVQYMSDYPDGAHFKEAQSQYQRLEEGLWNKARQQNNREGYAVYLRGFPKGRHATEAGRVLTALAEQPEDKEWAIAKASGSIAQIRAFIQKYPTTHYLEAATKEIKRLSPPLVNKRRVGSGFEITFENVNNPRLDKDTHFQDSLLINASRLAENILLVTPILTGEYTLHLTDDDGKKISLSVSTDEVVFDCILREAGDSLIFTMKAGQAPYELLFEPENVNQDPVRIEMKDTVLRVTRNDLYFQYDLYGNYQVRAVSHKMVDSNSSDYKEIGLLEIRLPLWLTLSVLGGLVAILALIIGLWIFFNRRINRRKTLLDE